MKTERMTLLITPSDKEAIAARAESLGLSVSELVRRAAVDYDPDDRGHLVQLAALVPELRQAAAEMRASLATAFAAADETRAALAGRETYRDKLRRSMEADPAIDWPAIQRLFGLGPVQDLGQLQDKAA